MRKLLTIITIAISFGVTCRASLYRTYQTSDGLSHNSVWAVMQDSRGYMWFGTNDGLNRFNGLNFKIYRRADSDSLSLGNNFIHCLMETADGKMLVGTKEGLYQYNPSTDKFSLIRLDGKRSGQDRTSIHCIDTDKSGNIWVGCYGQGIYCLSKDMKIKKHFGDKQLPSDFITAMTVDAAGNIWVGTDNRGLFRIDISSGKVTPTSLSDCNVQSLCRQNNNSLWVGTATDGLLRYNPLSNESTPVTLSGSTSPVRDIKAITPLSSGHLIMGSEFGLIKYDDKDGFLRKVTEDNAFDNLPDKSIFSIAEDNEGGLWLGTYFYGVCYRSPRINVFSFYPVGKTGDASALDIVRQFSNTPDGNAILTSRNSGLSVFYPNSGSFRELNGHAGNVQAVLADGNTIWLGNYDHGLSALQYPGGNVIKTYSTADGLPSNTINTIYRTSRGQLYVGTARGAAILDGNSFKPVRNLPAVSIMSVLEDMRGNIWFATHFRGLFKISSDGKVSNYTSKFGDASSIPGNNINNIFLDSRGKIWIGTEGEGLAVFNPISGKVEKRLSETNGLPSNIIYSTQEDDGGNMWIATGDGLVKINVEDNYSIQNFRYVENLLKIHYSHNSSLNLPSDKRIYFGGSGGFLAFNPSEISTNSVPPSILISSYTIDGKNFIPSAPLPERIEMEASESTLGIEVACISYLSPEQNIVAYRLVGYDDEWKYLNGSERQIQYMNLPWGDYTLEIKGANNDGVWSDPKTVPVTVNRPLLMSNVMLIVYLILLIFAGYIIKLRMNAVQRRKMVKFSHAKEKELYEAKIGFFTNIAHEIRTPLSLISAPLESILSSGDGTDRTRHNLEVMKSNVNRLLELINQLLDFRKVEAQLMRLNFHKCNVSEITLQICGRYEDFANLHRIKLDCRKVEPDIFCTLDAEAFEKIVGNLMSNAMKYADKHISISMAIDKNTEKLHLEIEDDGPGIKEKDIDKIFESFYRVDDHGKHPGSGLGLPLARSLAQMHSGSLTVESVYGHGSKFILEIPTTLPEGAEVTPEEDGDSYADAAGLLEQTAEKALPEKHTVLIVEDNEQLRNFIAENLEDMYNISTASNGIEAIKVLEKETVDLIVSDIMMPDMDGIELCRVVRSNPEYSHIPIVILSAKTDVDTKVEGLNIGADAYIEKPFSIEQLKAQIKSIFDSRERLQKSFIKSPLEYYKQHRADDEKEAEKAEFIKKLNDLILENLTNPDFSIDGLAQEFYMSRSSFHKRIKGITGETPNDYIRIVRLSKSAELLASGKYQIVEVCYMVGFNTPSYFSKCFARHFGKLPKEYINDLNSEKQL